MLEFWKDFMENEDGVGVVEIVLVLVVLIGLVLIRNQKRYIIEKKRFRYRLYMSDICLYQCFNMWTFGVCKDIGSKVLFTGGGRLCN